MYSKMSPILEGLHSRVSEAKDVKGVPVNQVRDMAKKMQLMAQIATNDVIMSFNDGNGDYDKTLTAIRSVYKYAEDLIEKLEQAKKVHEGKERENTEKEESVEEKHSIGGGPGKWAQMEIDTGDYCGNGGRSWVSKDSKNIDTWDTEEEAKADGLKNYKKTFKFGRDWKVVKLQESVDESADKPFWDVRYSYEGDSLSDYEANIWVQAKDGKEAVKRAEKYLKEKNRVKGPEVWNFRLDSSKPVSDDRLKKGHIEKLPL